MSTGTETRPGVQPEDPPPAGVAGKVLRGVGEALITLGLVVLLFVFYQVYVTDWVSAGKQATADAEMADRWRNERGDLPPIAGKGMANLYIPALGSDYRFTVIHGTTDADLEIGPGHYVGTALPGKRGNFAVAGHRVGKGAPFNDLDLVRSCDAIVVETNTSWHVYRMLPKAEEAAGWAQRRARKPACAEVVPAATGFGPEYSQTVGQEIVLPSENSVIAPVPHQPESVGREKPRAALLTLTTCHPRFSDAERLIVHAILVKTWRKDELAPRQRPPELRRTA